MSAPAVLIEAAGEKLTVRPKTYLGDKFQTYLGAAREANARFDAKSKRHTFDAERLEVIFAAMTRAGFTVEQTDAVIDLLRRKQSAAKPDGLVERITGKGLFPYQVAGAQWLAARDRALLADDMGLGKTVQALMAISTTSAIVVCPAAVKGVWSRECARWRPDLTPAILSGRKSWRWPQPGELVVVNYDILQADISGAVKTTLIADEAHALKNYKAARSEKFKDLSASVRKVGGKTWLLTGTPLLGKPFDLWGILGAANLGWDAFGSWQGFLSAFGMHKTNYGYSDPKPTNQAAECLRRVCLRRRKAEVLPDLPKKTHQDLFVEINVTGEAAAEVKRAVRALGYTFEQEWSEAEEEIVTSSIPIEIMSKLRAEIASAKIPAMLEIVSEYEESEEPLVVFSAHRAPILELGRRDGWAIITGDTSPEDRAAIVARFQDGQLRGVAATIAAGGVGLTLTHASNLLMVDLDWTPALNVQAEDRVCRIGQTRPVLIKRLVSDHPVDRAVQRVLVKKIELIRKTIEASTETDPTAVPKTALDRAVELAAKVTVVAPAKAPERLKIDLGNLPASHYAIGDPTRFFRVDRPKEGRHAGRTFLRAQHGANEINIASIDPDGTISAGFNATDTQVRSILQQILFDPAGAARRYGHEIGRCAVCGLDLTNEESRRDGIGPICAKKAGW